MITTPSLYDVHTIDTLEWPETEHGSYAKRFLEPLVKNGIQHYIHNIQAEISILKIDDFIFPVIVPTERHNDNSYVCSPYQHYITFGKQNVNLIPNPFIVSMVKPLVDLLGKMVKIGRIDSVVYVNNWTFSTDLYPPGLTTEHFKIIVDFLSEMFPEKAILFRSLNEMTNSATICSLKESGFKLIPSRVVYITDSSKEEIFRTRIFKSDLRLLNRSDYSIIDETELSIEDCDQFLRLRNLLYVLQHSTLHPQMNKEFMDLLFKQKLIHFKALKKENEIKGVVGYIQVDGVMYCPFFGFDKTEADHSVIYRLLNTILLLEAQKNAHFFNQSAGASFFKSVRRAEGVIEYLAVYAKHLPARQKMAWSTIKHCMSTLGVHYMKRF